MPQGPPAPTFVDNGGRHRRVPHSPPGCYQSTFPLRTKCPFAAHPKVVGALQCVTISLSQACLYPPPPRRPGVSIACAPSQCRRGCLMYTRTTSLPNLYIRNIIPAI